MFRHIFIWVVYWHCFGRLNCFPGLYLISVHGPGYLTFTLKDKLIMASNGLMNKAKAGTCRMCQRRRSTENKVKAVGEIRHGFATGHIWECIDIAECDRSIGERLIKHPPGTTIHERIKMEGLSGRYTTYRYFL
jgi:hypothetical protein